MVYPGAGFISCVRDEKLRKIISGLLFVSVVAGLLSGCSTRLTDFTVISSKNVELSRMGEYQRVNKRVKGVDTVHIISFIPTGMYPNAKNALDRAIQSHPGGVALVDGVITRKYFYIPLIYGRDWYEVEGSVLVDPTLR